MSIANIFDLIEPLWKVATELEKRNKIEILRLKLEIQLATRNLDPFTSEAMIKELEEIK